MTAPNPPDDAQSTVPWARQPVRQQPPATSRTRRIVSTLPSWEPLPPGEVLVRRPRER